MSHAICEWCSERFALPGLRTCDSCSIFDEDDSHECRSCGSELGLDGTCSCELGSARAPMNTWRDR